MPKIPILKPHEVVRLLETLQFQEVRQQGSHKQDRHADGRNYDIKYRMGRDGLEGSS